MEFIVIIILSIGFNISFFIEIIKSSELSHESFFYHGMITNSNNILGQFDKLLIVELTLELLLPKN